MAQYRQREAFFLMKYANKDESIVEWIWNSRDGVTPFGVTAKDAPPCNPVGMKQWADKFQLHHVQWQFDVLLPHYLPLASERVFVTLTLERAMNNRRAYVDRWWTVDIGDGLTMALQYGDKEIAINQLATHDVRQFGGQQPDVITGAEYRILHPYRYTNHSGQ